MRNTISHACGIARVVLACAVAAGIFGTLDFAVAQSDKKLTPIRLSVIPLLTATPIYVGIKNGYFQQEGIDIQLTKIEGGAPASQAVLSGSLDAAESGSVPFMIATARGAKIANVCTFIVMDKKHVLHGIVVRKDSGIKGLADLKGKTIGVHTLGSIEDIRVRAEVLPSLGLRPSDVKIVEVPFSVMEGALKSKRVDAVMPFQPFLQALLNDSDNAVLSDLNSFVPSGGFPFDTYIFAQSFVEKNPNVIASFDRAIKKSLEFIQADPQKAVELVSDSLRFPLALSKQAIGNIPFNVNCKHDATSYKNFADLMKAASLIPNDYNPNTFLKDPAR